jgi:hypothetical protein
MTPVHCLRCGVRASQTNFDSILRINKDDHFPAETVFYPFALQIRACHSISDLWRSHLHQCSLSRLIDAGVPRCESIGVSQIYFLSNSTSSSSVFVRCNRCAANEADGGEGAI